MPSHYSLSESEIKILQQGQTDVNLAAGYWFKPKDREPFIFDYKFAEGGKWQKMVHHAQQPNVIVVGGYGTGKTIGVGMSAALWCASVADFKFMNCAPVAFQARQMYDGIMALIEGTPFEKLVHKAPQRPFPRIDLKFYVGSTLVQSQLEFMSVDKNGAKILSWEGDWVNIDEGGRLDELEETTGHLGSRLRGSVRGRARLGRFSITTNSWDNFFLWYLFDLAMDYPEDYLSLVLSTRDNKNVTAAQLKQMLRRIPEEEHARWIDGTRPEGKGTYFSKESVHAGQDSEQEERILSMAAAEVSGYVAKQVRGPGYYWFEEPARPGRMYVLTGDPGTYNPPRRNAPAICVWDATGFPQKKAKMVALWWGFGNNSIKPFVDKFIELKEKYDPIIAGMDSTATQKNMAELMNIHYITPSEILEDTGKQSRHITALDFSGSKGKGYLVALRLLLEARLMTWPKMMTGIRSQLTNYDVHNDKKLAQDIVAAMSMSAHVIYSLFGMGVTDVEDEAEIQRRIDQIIAENRLMGGRGSRSSTNTRNKRGDNRRAR